MKLLVTLFLASSLFAGTIVPNIKWNKNEANDTGAAAAWSKRSNATLGLGHDHNSAIDWFGDAQVLYNYSGVAIELGALSDLDFDNQAFGANLGYMINSNFSIGLEYEFINHDSPIADSSRPSLSLDYKLANGLIIGAGYGRGHTNGIDADSNDFHLGVGHVANHYAAELVLNYTPQDDDGINQELGANLDIVYHFAKRWQLHGLLGYETSEFDVTGAETESSEFSITPELEYMINSNFFVNFAPSVSFGSSEATVLTVTTEADTSSAGLAAGFRTVWNSCQWEFDAGYAEETIEAGSVETDSENWTFRTAYTHHF